MKIPRAEKPIQPGLYGNWAGMVYLVLMCPVSSRAAAASNQRCVVYWSFPESAGPLVEGIRVFARRLGAVDLNADWPKPLVAFDDGLEAKPLDKLLQCLLESERPELVVAGRSIRQVLGEDDPLFTPEHFASFLPSC